MTEITLIYTAQITEIIKSENDDPHMGNKDCLKRVLSKELKAKLGADDVVVTDAQWHVMTLGEETDDAR